MSCSSDTAVTSAFCVMIADQSFYCTLEKKRVLKMLRAFFQNRPELKSLPREGIEQAIVNGFQDCIIHSSNALPHGIEFDVISVP